MQSMISTSLATIKSDDVFCGGGFTSASRLLCHDRPLTPYSGAAIPNDFIFLYKCDRSSPSAVAVWVMFQRCSCSLRKINSRS